MYLRVPCDSKGEWSPGEAGSHSIFWQQLRQQEASGTDVEEKEETDNSEGEPWTLACCLPVPGQAGSPACLTSCFSFPQPQALTAT